MSNRLLRTIGFTATLVLGLALLAGVTLVPRLAHAATFSVTDCTQYGTAVTSGTLAKAFADAEANAGADIISFGCDTTGAGIVFPSAVSPTQDLMLDATGHSVTLSGNNATQLFSLTTAGITLTLTHLTITEGKTTAGAGGAIYSGGASLVLNDCVFTKNAAAGGGGISVGGAIFLTGASLSISGGSFSENTSTATGSNSVGYGGAIMVQDGSLEIEDTTFSGNAASGDFAAGGAVYLNATPMQVATSTFSGNSATGTSNTARLNGGSGGALFLFDATGTSLIVNSTITSNTADGGAGEGAGGGLALSNYSLSSTGLSITNSTIAANIVTGSGTPIGSNVAVALFGPGVTITNTIISGGQGASNCSAAFTDGGHNLDSGMSCGFASPDSNQDPKLAPLADNGGPTQTMALLTGSPAIDTGADNICANAPVSRQDQRGVSRPQGAHCDIGAYELVIPTATSTSLTASTTSLTCGQKVTLTATVTGKGATGTVTFKDGATTLGTAPLSGGTATFTTTKLDSGAHSFTAVYGGTSLTGTTAFLPGTSTSVTVTVTGCNGKGGLDPAPAAPQAPQAPQPIPAGGANSPATSNGPAPSLNPDPATIQSKLNALAPKGHPTTAATSPSYPVQLILLLAGLLLAGLGATGLVVTRLRRLV